jgi:aryl-alcohol dehydrogenase-like predicted oxidoreductase
MQYRTLGATGLKVSVLGYGASPLAPVHNHAWHSGRPENNTALVSPYATRQQTPE